MKAYRIDFSRWPNLSGAVAPSSRKGPGTPVRGYTAAQLRDACILIVAGKTIQEAAEAVGMKTGTLSTVVLNPILPKHLADDHALAERQQRAAHALRSRKPRSKRQ